MKTFLFDISPYRQSKADNDVSIPRFNTRRSVRQGTDNKWKLDKTLVSMQGYLERKQQSNTGGKRSTIRSWKSYYTVLSGQLLCFFKDQNDFKESKTAAAAPILIHNATCEKAQDYTKKKYVIRLVTTDGSEFLFQANNRESEEEWLEKFIFHSKLEPSESVKHSSTVTRPAMAPPEPPANDVHNNGAFAEPLYANVGHEENSHNNDHDHDTSISSSEVDSKENKRPGRLSKLLGLKQKISTT